LKNSDLHGSVPVLTPDSNDGFSETASADPQITPGSTFDLGRKSDVLRNDIEDSNFDLKWEPGLLD